MAIHPRLSTAPPAGTTIRRRGAHGPLVVVTLVIALVLGGCGVAGQHVIPASGLLQASGAPATHSNPIRTSGCGMTLYLFVPQNSSPSQRYPLVLLLHGGGEKAIAGNSVASNRDLPLNQQYVAVWGPGYPKGQTVQTNWPSFVVVPQVVSPGQWVNTPVNQGAYSLAAQPTRWLSMAMDIVRLVRQQYAGIDANRLYITGISMGGYGVWDAIERWPDVFAAAVPVAGAGDPSRASRLIHLPIWDFHGAQDTVIQVSGSTSMYHAIASAGGHSCLTVYPDEQHGIWSLVYSVPRSSNAGSGLFAWLFAQRKGQPPTGSPVCSV